MKVESVVPSSPRSLHLAVALDGAGWHPAAWQEPDARPDDLLKADYWTDLVTESERALLDFVTIEDGLALQSDDPFAPDDRVDRVRGRLDAVLIASRVAPRTRHIGLVPTAVTTHTEPFHLSKAIATLDYISTGRAGVRVQISARSDVAAHFGRRVIPDLSAQALDEPAAQRVLSKLLGEAADYVEVLRRLWDSWEDDAEIRDVATGRFIDRTKLHYIDFTGEWFSVRGPSITPRPPQGQPIVAALGHGELAHRLIGTSADVGFVTPHDTSEATAIVNAISAHRGELGPGAPPVHVFADLVVFLDDTAEAAAARRSRLDNLAGSEFTSDAMVFVGAAAQLAELVNDWHQAGVSGFRLRPATIPHDLLQITDMLAPHLRRRGLFRDAYEAPTLRGLLGLTRPENRYATADDH